MPLLRVRVPAPWRGRVLQAAQSRCGRHCRRRRGWRCGRRGGRGLERGGLGLGGGAGRGGARARARREQLADQCQLGLHRRVAGIELQRLVVGLAGQARIDVAQVLLRRGVAGVGADGHFQRGACLVVLRLARVEHGQVVVGLGQLGVVLGQLDEGGRGVGALAAFGLDHALEKAHLRVARLGRQVLIGTCQRLGMLALAQQLADIAVVVGVGERTCQQGAKGEQPGAVVQNARERRRCEVHKVSLLKRGAEPGGGRYTAADCS